jgi:hypothetical protein
LQLGFYREKRALLSDEEFDTLKKVLYQTLLAPALWAGLKGGW